MQFYLALLRFVLFFVVESIRLFADFQLIRDLLWVLPFLGDNPGIDFVLFVGVAVEFCVVHPVDRLVDATEV